MEPNHGQPARRSGRFRMKTFLSAISKTVLTLLCFCVYLVISPIFLIFMTPLYIYRFFVIILQKICHPDWVGIMSTRDAVVGLDKISKKCECMITILLTLTGEGDIDSVREVFRREVIQAKDKHGRQCYLKLTYFFESWLGFTFWKREKFLLENHVRMLDLTEFEHWNNNNDFVTEEQLMKVMGSLATKPFPYGMSPWEFLVVKRYKRTPPKLHHDVTPTVPIVPVEIGPDKDVECAVVLRVHHAIGDGYSLMKLIIANLCGAPSSVVPKAPIRRISPLTEFFNYVAIMILTPYYHFLQFFLHIDRTIWHLPSTRLTKDWNFAITEKMSFQDIKTISKDAGVCVTATLLAGLGGGIHNYLKAKGLGRQNSRVMRGLSPMPWKDHPMDTLVNHWTLGVFEIPVHEPCPRKRLVAANKSANSLKKSPILLTNFVTVPLLLAVPNWLTDVWGTNWMTTMIISNFPGPDFPTIFNTKQYTTEVISWVPHMRGSAGLGIMFLSYNGGVRVSLSFDKAIMKDQKEVEVLSQYISQEFNNLRSLQPPAETVV